MRCESCNKKGATTHIQTIVDGKAVDHVLCAECAKKLGYDDIFSNIFKDVHSNFLDSLFGFSQKEEQIDEKTCDVCNMTFDEIAETGKVGCYNCYKTFYDELMPSIERIHGNGSFHKGKQAFSFKEKNPNSNDETLTILRKQLQEAIELQEFERAADIRDQIKLIEKQVNDNE